MNRNRSHNLHLIGMRGVGKSTLGSMVAARLNWTFVDADTELSRSMGMSIREIFDRFGESEFRRLESSVVQKFCGKGQQVIAWGGGVVIDPQNREALRNSGCCVWLKASPEVLWQRLQADPLTSTQRPALTDLEGLSELRVLSSSRHAAYSECADFSVDVENGLIDELAEEIARRFQMTDKLTK